MQLGPPPRSLDELKQQLAKRNAAAHAARIAVFREAEEPYARGIIRPEEGKLLAWLTTFFGGQLSEARLADLAGYLGQQSSVGRQMLMADVAGMLAADSDVAVVSVQMASPLEVVLEIPAALWLPFGFGFLALAERIAATARGVVFTFVVPNPMQSEFASFTRQEVARQPVLRRSGRDAIVATGAPPATVSA